MVLWRISRYQDLNGTGGLKASGRWHYAGQPVVYLSENPASTLLEICVHTSANDVPPSSTLLRIEGPDIVVPSITEADLSNEWRVQMTETQEIGTKWLQEGKAALLQVPNAIIPATRNYLFNPAHLDARSFVIRQALNYPFDVQLKL